MLMCYNIMNMHVDIKKLKFYNYCNTILETYKIYDILGVLYIGQKVIKITKRSF